MEDSVTTLRHCLTRQTCSLEKAEYEIVRNSILKNLLVYGPTTSERLGLLVKSHLKHKCYGSLWLYFEVVRMDLEARGEIQPVPNTDLQLIEFAGK